MPVQEATGVRRVDKGKNHSYTIDGQPVPGVTTLLSKGMPKPALPFWAAKRVASYVADLDASTFEEMKTERGRDGLMYHLKRVPFQERTDAATRGTAVHEAMDKMVHGHRQIWPAEMAPYAEAGARFLADWQPRPVLTETVIGSRRWMYAGTFDLIADLPDGRRVLFDYKTSQSGIWPETAMQLAAYRYADFYAGTDGTEIPMSEVGIDECMAVWLRPGAYSVLPLQADDAVFRTFLHVQHVARTTDVMAEWIQPEVFPHD